MFPSVAGGHVPSLFCVPLCLPHGVIMELTISVGWFCPQMLATYNLGSLSFQGQVALLGTEEFI